MQLRLIPLLVLTAGCGVQSGDSPFRETGEVIAFSGGRGRAQAACFTCHGVNGEGDGRATPRIAGADAGYLHRQLDDYATGRREHGAMREIASQLDGDDRLKVSAYYASLPLPAPAQTATAGFAAAADQGEARIAAIYQKGDPSRGLPSCAECHGEKGEGRGAAYPALAGQPTAYLERQLRAWREGRRHNDPLGQMLAISRLLSHEEVQALSVHAAALPGQRLPEAPEASPAEHHADPRNDASGQPPHGAGS